MNIYPQNTYNFKLANDQISTIGRLQRRTELSHTLTSKTTDKSFIGSIKENDFKLITSEIGKGAFVVMIGRVNEEKGYVKTEINKLFRILVAIIYFFPLIAVLINAFTNPQQFSPILFLVALIQIGFFRFMVGVVFRMLSRQSLNRLSDILDIQNLQKVD